MISGHFIPSGEQHVFISQFGHPNPQKTLLLLPSIFEEVNLCRAVVAKQAQFLAQQGYCVFCLDYAGCGDSEGEIEQVAASVWRRNIVDCVTWLKQQGADTLTIFGVRFGGLLAFQDLAEINQLLPIKKIILWKPVTKGKQFMTQFLRLKQANSMMQGQANTKINWREAILAGQSTEVAGYEITAALLSSIDALAMPKQLAADCVVYWFELAATNVTPAVTMQTQQWNTQNTSIRCFPGSAFWQIPEIFVQSALHQPTLDALEGNV